MVTLTVLSPQGSGHLGLVLPQWLEDSSRALESEPLLLLADWVPSELWGLQKGLAHSRGSVNMSFFLLSPLPTCHPQPVFTITAPSLSLCHRPGAAVSYTVTDSGLPALQMVCPVPWLLLETGSSASPTASIPAENPFSDGSGEELAPPPGAPTFAPELLDSFMDPQDPRMVLKRVAELPVATFLGWASQLLQPLPESPNPPMSPLMCPPHSG